MTHIKILSEAQKYLNPGGIADSVASFDVETDSVLTAVDIGKPNAGIDIAPAVCTMDFIGEFYRRSALAICILSNPITF